MSGFFYFTHSFNFIQICIESSTGSTHRKYLDEKVFLNHDIVLPSKAEQIEMVKRYKEQSKVSNNLSKEIRIQKGTLSQLKQAILQEAINGKLTQEWREQNPNTESASELLERIKTEKKQLIKNKKIRKGKPLPPITEEEIPFELPENWVWCRVGNITNVGTGATPLTSNKSYYSNGKIPWVTSSATGSLFVEKPENFITEKALNETNCNLNPKGTLVVAMYGQGKTRGQITELMFESATNQACATIQPYLKEVENRRFIKLYFQNIYLEIRKLAQGGAQPNLNMGKIKNTIIPFPPIEEQKAIVEKVDTLMQKCEVLEMEITQSEQHANMLMQAVLKEAFESKTEQETKVVKLDNKLTNIDYYKRTLLATEIVWQLHKEPTLGHLKLQKLMYLAQESGKMQLPTNFLQQVAGPYDPQMARSLDKQMKTKKWFEYKKTEMLKFKPLAKAGEHKPDFEKFFANEKESIQYIIDTFKTAKSDQVEIVGTLYACWNKLIDEKQIVSDELLTKRFYEWSEEKAKFEKNRIIKALRWMETKGIVPEYANA